ncbi:neutral zinc metallopeptidase family protein [Mycobacterium ulcerans str. Harvey]|uniref:Neutral zinc metallopeptidase family protein n=1 Tax=Mycobacterium ulcerans str. Harvey TaxID=1299332 RepID=A0ABN0R957_MYCUL|nr:neutral zinc metallopeptidase family protein [Mycobacterium ulcerans str. Harvey]
MQIDTSPTSSSGGGGFGRMAIGGGIGGLLIVVVAMFLGVDPGGVLSQQPMDDRDVVTPGFDLSQCKTGADANKYVQCRVVATGNSLDAVWTQLMPDRYTRPHLRLFSGQVSTGCGPASSEVGPFYCPVDQTAYFDTDFFQLLVTEFGSSGGPFAQEYVVAHEYGHHVQNLLGVLGRAQQGAKGAGAMACAPSCRPTVTRGLGTLCVYRPARKYRRPLPGAVERQGYPRRALSRGIGGRRSHPAAGGRTQQPRDVDARLLGATAEVVHRRVSDQRPQQM